MKVPQMILAELRRLGSTRMSLIALIALMVVPILYGGLYLWANRDPYGQLDQVPVALVVADTGAPLNGTDRNLGDEVAQELIEDGAFDWHLATADEADAGLDEGAYDFAIELPADFTASIASITSGEPRTADIVLHTSDANNYLASTIGTQAVERIQTTITEKVVAEAGLTMLDALDTIRIQLTDAATGATQLVDGLALAGDGASPLHGCRPGDRWRRPGGRRHRAARRDRRSDRHRLRRRGIGAAAGARRHLDGPHRCRARPDADRRGARHARPRGYAAHRRR
jgi:putative membrane protein